MSRLSLKPGGEPGMWSFRFPIDTGGNMETTGEAWWVDVPDVPDSDLMDIRSTLSEYLDAKYEVVEPEKPKESHPIWLKYALCGLLAMFALCFAAVGFLYGWSRVPTIPPSTGGVIDQLCMRPDIECSTSIRYVHPQKSGIVEQGDPVPQMECVAVDPQGNYHPEPCSKSEEQ